MQYCFVMYTAIYNFQQEVGIAGIKQTNKQKYVFMPLEVWLIMTRIYTPL